jgi:hypothetical protein
MKPGFYLKVNGRFEGVLRLHVQGCVNKPLRKSTGNYLNNKKEKTGSPKKFLTRTTRQQK